MPLIPMVIQSDGRADQSHNGERKEDAVTLPEHLHPREHPKDHKSQHAKNRGQCRPRSADEQRNPQHTYCREKERGTPGKIALPSLPGAPPCRMLDKARWRWCQRRFAWIHGQGRDVQ